MGSGKRRRIKKILGNNERSGIIVAVDDSLIDGPKHWLNKMDQLLSKVAASDVTGLIAFKWTLLNAVDNLVKKSIILNLTASTNRGNPLKKVVVSNVEDAIRIGADAVACHINFTSEYESEMFESVGKIHRDCQIYDMPLLVFAYCRKYANGKVDSYEHLARHNREEYLDMVCHSVRAAAELGADIVKVMFWGTSQDLPKIPECIEPTPVLLAGGPCVQEKAFLNRCRQALDAGFSGILSGRNIFQRKSPETTLAKLVEIVKSANNKTKKEE